MEKNAKIYLAGHRGFIGPAILKQLHNNGYQNIIYQTSKELNLTDSSKVDVFFKRESPKYVILNAAKASSISDGKTFPVDQMMTNGRIAENVIASAHKYNAEKLLYISSATVYPSEASNKISENLLFSGPLDPNHKYHALSKIWGMELCQAYNTQYNNSFISAIPTNIYGPGDVMVGENVHVISGMMQRFHEAKILNKPDVQVWGSGKPQRDFLYVDDLADACIFLLENYNDHLPINIGSGIPISIKDVAESLKSVIQYKGNIVFNTKKPDGAAYRVLDNSHLLSLGWKPKTSLYDGLSKMYNWYLEEHKGELL